MYFITGANGLIGCHLIAHLLQTEDVLLKCLVRTSAAKSQLLEDVEVIMGKPIAEHQLINMAFFYGDIFNNDLIADEINPSTVIVHAAACVSFNPKDRQKLFDTNVNGTANLVNIALDKNAKAFCYLSSVAAIGRMSNNLPITEQTEWQDSKYNTAYAVSKFHAELEVWRGAEEGLNVIIVNPTVVLGYTSKGNSSSSIFYNIKKGFPFTSNGINGFVGAADVAAVMVKLIKNETFGERYVLVAELVAYKTLFIAIAKGLGKKPPTVIVKPWMKYLVLPMAWILGKLTGKAPFVTKEVFNTSQKKLNYSAEKIKTTLDYQFTPVFKVVENVCRQMS